MSNLYLPAPFWRRLAAAVYDGLLLVGIWMVTLVVEEVVRDSLLHLPRDRLMQQGWLFVTGLLFFGWFWTHGGQTLGMRVWRLQVRRLDGAPLRWPIAVLRYAAMLLAWSIVLAPLLLSLPRLRVLSYAGEGTAVCTGLIALGLLLFLFDGQRRAPQDFVAGTVVIALPRESAHARQPVDGGTSEQQ